MFTARPGRKFSPAIATAAVVCLPLLVAGCSSNTSSAPAAPETASSATGQSTTAAPAYCDPLQKVQEEPIDMSDTAQLATVAAYYQQASDELKVAGMAEYADMVQAASAQYKFFADHPDPNAIMADPALSAQYQALAENATRQRPNLGAETEEVAQVCHLKTSWSSTTDTDSGDSTMSWNATPSQ